jgi:hypothetical protein
VVDAKAGGSEKRIRLNGIVGRLPQALQLKSAEHVDCMPKHDPTRT